jgi:hypothetical protein
VLAEVLDVLLKVSSGVATASHSLEQGKLLATRCWLDEQLAAHRASDLILVCFACVDPLRDAELSEEMTTRQFHSYLILFSRRHTFLGIRL